MLFVLGGMTDEKETFSCFGCSVSGGQRGNGL
jgi:hypothetical protein